jgi:hypothetical protein
MAFAKKKVEDRKRWLGSYVAGTFLDQSVDKISYSDFINKVRRHRPGRGAWPLGGRAAAAGAARVACGSRGFRRCLQAHRLCAPAHSLAGWLALPCRLTQPPCPLLPLAQELILFSRADLDRSIPSMVDGLKPGQRKIMYGMFKGNFKKEIKVRQPGQDPCCGGGLSGSRRQAGSPACLPAQAAPQRLTARPAAAPLLLLPAGGAAGGLRGAALGLPPRRDLAGRHHRGPGAELRGQQQH